MSESEGESHLTDRPCSDINGRSGLGTDASHICVLNHNASTLVLNWAASSLLIIKCEGGDGSVHQNTGENSTK